MVLPALIGAGATLIGGMLSKPKTQSANKNSYDSIMGQARGARDASDRYGFNPLTLLGASSAVGPSTSGNYMGNAIADAGMIVADGLAKRSEQLGQITKLSEENALLKKEIQNATLRPKIAGVYAQRQMTPSLAGALGRSGKNDLGRSGVGLPRSGGDSGDDSAFGPDHLRPLPESYQIDPRRPPEHEEQKSHSGFMVVDNPYFPKIHIPTLDGDEAMGPGEALMLGPYAVLSAAASAGASSRDWVEDQKSELFGTGPVYTVNGRRYQQRKPKKKPRLPTMREMLGLSRSMITRNDPLLNR